MSFGATPFAGAPLSGSFNGAGGIGSAETFGALSLADGYFGFWGKHPRISARRLQDAPLGAISIASAEEFGVPHIAASLHVHSITTATATGSPVIRHGVILQDEEFFLLAA